MHRFLALSLLAAAAAPALAAGPSATLRLVPVDRQPSAAARALTDDQLAALRQAVVAEPKDRGKRLALVQALVAARRLDDALAEARAWREADAYDLVVVRMIGDIYTELGRTAEARRAYSAVVELLPTDPQAQRALSSVLKQQGDLDGAYQRLVAAAALRPKDIRIQLELADVAQRLGRID